SNLLRGDYFRRSCPARLLSSLQCNSLPTIHPFTRSGDQMPVRPVGNDGNDSRCSEFCCLFNGPLHAIEFENREQKRDLGSIRYRNWFPELKLDSTVLD